MSSYAMLLFCILGTLFYSASASGGRRKDSAWKKLKTTINEQNEKTASELPNRPPFEAGKVFLKHLYHNHFNEDGQMKTKNVSVSEIVHSVQGNVDVKSKVIRFNTKGINPREYIQKAEIRVKAVHYAGQDANPDQPVKLGLYEKMTGHLISQASFRGTEPTWIVFMVRSAVYRWLRYPFTNRGVRIQVMADSRTRGTVPVVSIYSGRNGPFMVVYTDGRRLHGVEDSRLFLGNRIRRDSTQTKMNNKSNTAADPSNLCSRRDLQINAKRVFGDLLIAPLSFNAYDCAGKCDLTFAPRSFSNHAIVRSMAGEHWNRKENATAACCVATSFSSQLGVLHSKDGDHVVLRRYKNMVATECGCR